MNMDELQNVFEREAKEYLSSLEEIALRLDESPNDTETINEAFRAIHTIKGAGAMYGFEEISDFLHEIETVLDLVREGKVPVSKKLVDLLLEVKDVVLDMLTKKDGLESTTEDRTGLILEGFNALVPSDMRSKDDEGMDRQMLKKIPDELKEKVYQIQFTPESDFYLRGFDQERIFNQIREFGWTSIREIKRDAPPDITDDDRCYLSWDIILCTSHDIDHVRDVFIFFDEGTEYSINIINGYADDLEDIQLKKLGEILVERGDISSDDLQRALSDRKLIGEYLVAAGLLGPERLESALFEQSALSRSREERKERNELSTIRVSFQRLDNLVDLIGELVAAQASLSQIVSGWDDIDSYMDKEEIMSVLSENNFEVLSKLLNLAEQFHRLTKNIRDMTMDMRMVPIGTTFSKYKRLVRDLSKELGRNVKLETEGGETEFDKSIIDRLSEPLIHLIRNAIDHGIESPAERKTQGKDPVATVRMVASHSGSSIFITISDDGQGLDAERIVSQAIKAGLITSKDGLAERDIYMLIFAPGFTTAAELTSVSGRGVGMDAVKKTIESLSGNVYIESKKGQGTKITLKIPLTLAIIDGLLVRIGDDSYIVPLSIVEECIEVASGEILDGNKKEMIKVRDELIPYINLRRMFGSQSEPSEFLKIAIINIDNIRIGLLVDSIAGKYQTVIKPMGALYRGVRHISGATILGDGSVALILDANQLVRFVAEEEEELFRHIAQSTSIPLSSL